MYTERRRNVVTGLRRFAVDLRRRRFTAARFLPRRRAIVTPFLFLRLRGGLYRATRVGFAPRVRSNFFRAASILRVAAFCFAVRRLRRLGGFTIYSISPFPPSRLEIFPQWQAAYMCNE